jgi:hypothetical protein
MGNCTQGIFGPMQTSSALVSQQLDRTQSESLEPSSPKRLSLALKKGLVIQVEEDRVTDEETPFTVNRLISCPNLTPSIARSQTPSLATTTFIAVNDLAFGEEAYNPALVNWAEHSPITPRQS